MNSTLGSFDLIEVTRRGEPFRKGSSVERLLGNRIPAGGVAIGGLQLRRPELITPWEDSPLTVWLLYRGTTIRSGVLPPLFGSRVLAENSTGRQIENPLPSIHLAAPNESLISIPLFAFPRDEHEIRLRFSPPATNEAAREWLTFKIENPYPSSPKSWPTEQLPKTNVVHGETVVLRNLKIDPVKCEFELPGPGWTISHCSIQDSEGNLFQSSGRHWNSNLPALLWCDFTYTLETNRPWSVEATFVRATNFATSDKRTVRLAQNVHGAAITNQIRQVSDFFFDGTSINLAGKPGEGPPQWIITAATNVDNGFPIRFFMDAVWFGITGGSITKSWPLEGQCTNLIIEIADPKTFTANWYVDPSRISRRQEETPQ